jgi:hypothetical protein
MELGGNWRQDPEAIMHGEQRATRIAVAAASLLCALAVATPMAFAENAGSTDASGTAGQAGPTAASSAAPTTTPTTPPAVTILNKHEVEGILGREVRSSSNENMGRIVDVLVDRSGQVRAAIIDFGGFLGVGSRKIAVDWNALHFPPPEKSGAAITLDLSRAQVAAAPQYQEGKPVVVLGALGRLEPLPE